MPILFFVLRGGDKFSAFVDKGGKQAIMVVCTTMQVQPVYPDTEAAMDITEREITKIAREAEKLVLLTLREKGVGTAEIDLIHALRHHPGCTQAALAELLHADKAAIARRTKNLEAKGYLVRKASPNDRRSQLLYPTEKAESLKSSKAEIEAEFYEYLTSALPADEAAAFAATLHKLYTASKTESRAGFPHFKQATEGEAEHAE